MTFLSQDNSNDLNYESHNVIDSNLQNQKIQIMPEPDFVKIKLNTLLQ